MKARMGKPRNGSTHSILQPEQIDGCNVHIVTGSICQMMIWYADRNGCECCVSVKVPKTAVPRTWFDKRTVHFTKDGLDIRDETHTRILPVQGSVSTTIPKDKFRKAIVK